MSLWSVYRQPTHALMSRFVERLRGCPPDKALRSAMLEARRSSARVAEWAGFSVFGFPERPHTTVWNDPTCGAKAP
jgi:CHAT domain-containing protein